MSTLARAQVVRFLSLAEAIGSRLLTANTTKLAATLAEFRRVCERDVYSPLLASKKFSHGEHGGERAPRGRCTWRWW
jgi:hypothetical protein